MKSCETGPTVCLLTLFIKSSGIGRTAETKVNLETARDFFPIQS